VLRFLLVEAAQVTVRSLPEWRSKYLHLMMRRGRKTAKDLPRYRQRREPDCLVVSFAQTKARI
jgi:hypothetical protein